MGFHRTLGELLLAEGLVTLQKLEGAKTREEMGGPPLGVCLVEDGVAEERVAALIVREFGYPLVDPLNKKIGPEHLALIPKDLAQRFAVIPLFLEKAGGRRTLFVAMADPTCVEAIEWVELHAGASVRPVVALLSLIRKAITRFYEESTPPPAARLRKGARSRASSSAGVSPGATQGPAQKAAGATSDFSALDQASSVPQAEQASTRQILQAVTELLLEKEVLSKEELIDRVTRIKGRSGGPREEGGEP